MYVREVRVEVWELQGRVILYSFGARMETRYATLSNSLAFLRLGIGCYEGMRG